MFFRINLTKQCARWHSERRLFGFAFRNAPELLCFRCADVYTSGQQKLHGKHKEQAGPSSALISRRI